MPTQTDPYRVELLLAAELARLTDTQERAMAAAWAAGWAELATDVFEAINDVLSNGKRLTTSTLLRSDRLTRTVAAIADVLDDLARDAGVTITGDLARVTAMAQQATKSLIDSQMGPTDPRRLFLGLRQAPAPELAAIVARSTEQVTSLLQPVSADTHAIIVRELIRGTAAGDNPRETARRMTARVGDGFELGRRRAENIARTETLDAYREGARASQDQHADVLAGWVWLAHLGSRTCRSCLAMHGTVHGLDEAGPHDHQQGRCSRCPVVAEEDGSFDLSWVPSADEHFAGLPESDQIEILGRKGYQAWAAGEFPREEWTKRRENDGWRDSQVPASPGDPAAGTGAGSSGGSGTPPAPPTPPAGGAEDGGEEPAAFRGLSRYPRYPDLNKLSDEEKVELGWYASAGHENINKAMRGLIPMTDELRHSIETIRAGLSKYPLDHAVRVTRETDLHDAFGLQSYDDVASLVGRKFDEPAFMSTSSNTNPPRLSRGKLPVWLDLVAPAGTPALPIVGELLDPEYASEREVLVIDARRFYVLDVLWDSRASRWRVYAAIAKEE